ncbi:MAG: class I SAM-dependent methyltransferase [Candidatus Gracilibacteria bacterium]|nr:class I SAM-dependent methyltransferase [Candidatus Gracilibacteria bacterium]
MLKLNKELVDNILAVSFPDLEKNEQQAYLKDHSKRILYTFNKILEQSLPDGAKVLDLGAKPYLLAYFVKKFSKLNYIGVGYSIKELAGEAAKEAFYEKLPVEQTTLNLGEEISFPMWQLNIERAREPFADNSIDLIVCTETVEHLVQDPNFLISEIYRILKPGGKLIFSVPNAIYWGRILKLALGKNIDDPYSIHGPYGRHNRNYTKQEVLNMMRRNNFKKLELGTKNFTELEVPLQKRLVRMLGDFLNFPFPNRIGKTVFGIFEK